MQSIRSLFWAIRRRNAPSTVQYMYMLQGAATDRDFIETPNFRFVPFWKEQYIKLL